MGDRRHVLEAAKWTGRCRSWALATVKAKHNKHKK
jgi:hypothetical protein